MLALAAASTTVSAQTQYPNQSPPFSLQIANAANASLNGQYLYACHTGAAQDAMCLTPPDSPPTQNDFSTKFFYNTTSTTDGSTETRGILVWNLPVQVPGADHVSQAMEVTDYHLGTNVDVPELGLGTTGTRVEFEAGKLVITDRFDDSTFTSEVPPPDTGAIITYNNWYVCWNRVGGGYWYQTLAWVTAGEPHNPTCEKVDVVLASLDA